MTSSTWFKSFAVAILTVGGPLHADIFQWEYIDPADPAQGKRQSTTLAPDGAGVDAVPGALLGYRNLTMAYFANQNLTDASFYSSNLTNADFRQANLTNADFAFARLVGADFSDAEVRQATFDTGCDNAGCLRPGLSLAQLYSTASYQAKDLTGIALTWHDLTGANFAGQNLTNAYLVFSTLTNADFTDAVIRGANLSAYPDFGATGITLAQLYSTASYQAKDLGTIDVRYSDLAGGNFSGHNFVDATFSHTVLTGADFNHANLSDAYLGHAMLTSANFSQTDLTNAFLFEATLAGADFTDANVRGAVFYGTTSQGFTQAQLYSTASFQARDLSGISLEHNNLTGWSFAGQDLSNARFHDSILTGADFTGAEVRGAVFEGMTLTQLYSTANYQAGDLSSVSVRFSSLAGGNFSHQNLTNASFYFTTLTDADFTDAVVRGTEFRRSGIALAQLYSTANYKAHNLSGIRLMENDLTGGNFSHQNLTNASFYFSTLTDADFTGADARGADSLNWSGINFIRPDGYIDGLDLDAGGLLVVRDYDGNARNFDGKPIPPIPIPIRVGQHLTMGPSGTLRLVFEADAWDSTISFAPGIPVTRGGTLELTFAADVNPASQVGRTLKIFDWTGVTPTGAFTVSSPYAWDTSQLYTTGEVTLTAVPEPSAAALAIAALLGLVVCGRRSQSKHSPSSNNAEESHAEAQRRGGVKEIDFIGSSALRPPRFCVSLFLIAMRLGLSPYSAAAAVVLTGWVAPSFADLPMTGTYVPELQAVDTLLQNFMVGKPIPGGTIAITHNDKVIYERGIGYSNAALTEPMQETALLRLASVSKPITASAIQQLAKDGQLNLDAKVFDIDGNGGILNIAPYNGTLGDSRLGDITVQHLLEHQGGWNRDTAGDLAFRDVQIANALGVPSPPGIDNTAQYILSRPLQFTPGTAYNYSNIGYMFLGMVVEEASGEAYESYVESHVLAPAGIPAWEVDAGRTFAADQNPREPFYSDPNLGQNVYNPTGPTVPWPYGGWDNEKALAFGGLIASSKAIALLAQSRIAAGPEIGKLRTDYTTYPEYSWYHYGSLPGTDTLIAQRTLQDSTYSILFDRRPTDGSSYSDTLSYLLESALDGLSSWPAALEYAGDFTNDQWLTLDDITLFTQALVLGSEAAFALAYPNARYSAGDFDGNSHVNASDAAGLIAALENAGVPAGYIALVPELPGDYNRDRVVDAADYVVWRKNLGLSINLPNETLSLGLVDQADYDQWRANFGVSLGAGSGSAGYLLGASAQPLPAAVPEPTSCSTILFCFLGLTFHRRRKTS